MFLIGIIFIFSAFIPQGKNPDQDAIRKDLHRYVQTNVAPELEPYRISFQDELSDVEVKQIEDSRLELKKVVETRMKIRKGNGGDYLLGSELDESQAEQLKGNRDLAYKALLRVMIIADTHGKKLDEVFGSVSDKQEEWIEDMENIITGHAGNRPVVMNPLVKQNMKHLLPMKNLNHVLFLLWDPDQALIEE